jgi:serine/threonine protein kinase
MNTQRAEPRQRSFCLQVFLTQTHLAIAMEYAQGGDMFKYICRHKPHCRLLESQARWIFQQLIIGLDYCHNKVQSVVPAIHPTLYCRTQLMTP